MDKSFLQDKKLSWKAKGIMAYMLSKPDNWTFYMDELIQHSTDGKASFRSGFNELREMGYVKRHPIRKGNRIVKWETIVLENPANSLLTDFQEVEKQEVENQEVGNRTLLNNDSTKNDSTKNDKQLDEVFRHYISKNIIQHRKFDADMKRAVKRALKKHGYNVLIEVIDNYAKVFHSNEHWFKHKYTLIDLMRDKDIRQFGSEADPLYNFAKDKNKYNKKNVETEHKIKHVDSDAFMEYMRGG